MPVKGSKLGPNRPPEERHGRYSDYARGCKCDLCVEAGRVFRAKRQSDPDQRAKFLDSQAKYRASDRGQAKRREHKAAAKAAIRDLIMVVKTRPCADCRASYPYYVMDFDHVRGEKSFNISASSRLLHPFAEVVAEIEKCDVVCSNCHRERTHQRLTSG
jgi:hypothetical protein